MEPVTTDITLWIADNEPMIRAALRPIAQASTSFRGMGVEETLTELTVETVARLLEREASFDPQRPPLGWILGFAQKIALGWKRDAAREGNRREELPQGQELSDKGMATQQIEKRILSHQILKDLPLQDQELIQLFVMEDRTAQEVGQHLGITAAAVRVRWHRLQQKLQMQHRPEDGL